MDRMTAVSFPEGVGIFSYYHHLQTGSGEHPASYSMETGASFPRDKAVRARN
jgi:hypothetical protein